MEENLSSKNFHIKRIIILWRSFSTMKLMFDKFLSIIVKIIKMLIIIPVYPICVYVFLRANCVCVCVGDN